MEDIDIQIKVSDVFSYPTIRSISLLILNNQKEFKKEHKLFPDKIIDEIEDQVVIKEIKPFNDIFYKNCFHNSLLSIVISYNLDIIPLIINDIIYYKFRKNKKNIIIYEEVENVENILNNMNISVNKKEKSNNIITDIIISLKHKKPVIIWIDSYYNPIIKNKYLQQHHPHSLLIFGYNSKKKIFNVIEHTDIDALNYNERTISYEDIWNAYYGFLNNYYKGEGYTYYDFFSYGVKGISKIITANTFKKNFLQNKEKIILSLQSINEFSIYFANICDNENSLFINFERLITKVNDIINAKKILNYRDSKIFVTLQSPAMLSQIIIEHWNIIRLILIKLYHQKKIDNYYIELCIRKIKNIYDLELIYNNVLEVSFITNENFENQK